MTPCPKPARRSPKPPRPIARSRAPIPRRRAGKRRSHTCRELLERRAAERLADRLWSFLVEMRAGGAAQDPGVTRRGHHAHHLLPKGAHPSVRFDLENGAWVSWDYHRWLHDHRGEMPRFGLWVLGRDAWDALRARAVADRAEDSRAAVARLRREVLALGMVAEASYRGLM